MHFVPAETLDDVLNVALPGAQRRWRPPLAQA